MRQFNYFIYIRTFTTLRWSSRFAAFCILFAYAVVATSALAQNKTRLARQTCATLTAEAKKIAGEERSKHLSCVAGEEDFVKYCVDMALQHAISRYIEFMNYHAGDTPEQWAQMCLKAGAPPDCKTCLDKYNDYGRPLDPDADPYSRTRGRTYEQLVADFIVDFIKKNPGINPFMVDWGICPESLSNISSQRTRFSSWDNWNAYEEDSKGVNPAFMGHTPVFAVNPNCPMVLKKGQSFDEYLAQLAAPCKSEDYLSQMLPRVEEQAEKVCKDERQAKASQQPLGADLPKLSDPQEKKPDAGPNKGNANNNNLDRFGLGPSYATPSTLGSSPSSKGARRGGGGGVTTFAPGVQNQDAGTNKRPATTFSPGVQKQQP